MVKLAMYKGRGQVGNAFIRWWTGSQYSHCELVVAGWSYSSSMMDKGVRRKLIDHDDGKWDLIELPWADENLIRSYFYETDANQYGWLGLIRSQLFNRGRNQEGAQFCSEWCANALGLPNAPSYSPSSLANQISYINSKHI
jgi:hypothetical protein